MKRLPLWALASALASGCGAAPSERGSPGGGERRIEAEDLGDLAVLVRSDLTTAVDERRYRPAAPAATEFAPETPAIYLVGKLKYVPTQAAIEVRWFREGQRRPMLASEVAGSDSYEFIASFSPEQGPFGAGRYTARVYVDGREVGAIPFSVVGEDPLEAGPRVKGLAVSKKIGRDLRPKRKATSFSRGTKRVYATFSVDGVGDGAVVEVRWTRGGTVFHEEDLDAAEDGRMAAQIFSRSGLPDGEYAVEVSAGCDPPARLGFAVGRGGGGPSIDDIGLGEALDRENMPVKRKTSFDRNVSAIHCGLRFLDLAPGSEIAVEWVQLLEGGDSLWHTTQSSVPGGGSGTLGAAWEPDAELEPGEYAAVVKVNGEVVAEARFEVR